MTSETDDGNFIYLSVGDALEIYAASSNSLPGRPPITYEARTRSKGRSARPASYAHYQQADSALQAAVLAHGIAETQPFVDGNKRTALVAMLTFLELNGYTLSAADPELAAWIISFSSGAAPETIADQIRPHIEPSG